MLRFPRVEGWFSSALAALAAAALVASCGTTPPSDFYALSPLPAGEEPARAESPFRVGLQPIELPKEVDRAQMVFSVSPYQREVAEFSRWAGPLEDLITGVLEHNLEQRLGLTAVYRQPARSSPNFQYLLSIQIASFDSELDGTCRLRARFHVTDPLGHWLHSQSFESSEASRTEGPAGVATAMSLNLAHLSDAIATSLNALHAKPGTPAAE